MPAQDVLSPAQARKGQVPPVQLDRLFERLGEVKPLGGFDLSGRIRPQDRSITDTSPSEMAEMLNMAMDAGIDMAGLAQVLSSSGGNFLQTVRRLHRPDRNSLN